MFSSSKPESNSRSDARSSTQVATRSLAIVACLFYNKYPAHVLQQQLLWLVQNSLIQQLRRHIHNRIVVTKVFYQLGDPQSKDEYPLVPAHLMYLLTRQFGSLGYR